MIFICVKWKVKPEYADRWVELTRDFTENTRAEAGNLFFDWSRSVDDSNEYVLIEAFKDEAAEPHVTSDHFKRAKRTCPSTSRRRRGFATSSCPATIGIGSASSRWADRRASRSR